MWREDIEQDHQEDGFHNFLKDLFLKTFGRKKNPVECGNVLELI